MIDLLPYQKSIEKELDSFEFSNNPANLYDPLRYFLKIGGKRMRPILALMACELYDKDLSQALNASMAVELFHNFSLIHDDIMDQAPLRRGKDTVHVKWNENIAILSGDVLLVKSYQAISQYESKIALELLKLFNQTAIEVCEGQQWDMDFETTKNVSIADYIQMIKYKTAVLVGCSLEMGAIVAEASSKDRKALYDFGVNLGLAFQLQDDLLDVFADQSKFGKQVGGDILANKKTFLLLTAFQDADEKQEKVLIDLQKETDGPLKIEKTKEIYKELNIKLKTQNKIDEFYKMAMNNFNSIAVPNSKKEPLLELSNFLINREH
ncbi:MAG: polyprenyl synthetase family protein [Crocinitomicaceae bacterium]